MLSSKPEGKHVSLAMNSAYGRAMNCRLSDLQIRATCRELLAKKKGPVSGRRLCRELRERFGAVGKATRLRSLGDER